MNLRLLPIALFLLGLAASTAISQVPLKPFQPSATAEPKSFAGAWKGTFIFDRKDSGGKEEVSYLVEVGADMGTLKVTALPPYSSNPDSRLSPITEAAIPADWDGDLLKAQSQQSYQDGKAQVVVSKRYLLKPGTDSRHIGVSYEVTVKTTQPRKERSETVCGKGTLVRVR